MGIVERVRARIPILAAATLGALPCLTPAATHFASPSFHDSGKAPTAMVAADFNGDGKLDLAIAFTQYLPGNNGKVGIQLNNGSGAGSPPFALNCTPGPQCDPAGGVYTVGKNPLHIAAGVFNASGRKDLAVVNQGDNSISILLNDGSGAFTVSSTTLATGSSPAVIAIGDFNGDGKADIAVTNTGDNNVSVFLGDGAGAFSAASTPTFSTGSQPIGIDAADIDGDGKIDLVVANFGANTVSFHKGNGNGTFQSAVTKSTTYTGPVRVKAGFIDGDGFRDVAVAAQDGTSGGFEVLRGDGTGAFAAATAYQVALPLASRFALGRWEGDAVDDVALLRSNTSITVLKTYKFGTPDLIEDNDVGFLLIDLAAGDFDGDGVIDLAVLVRASSVDFSNYLVILRKTQEAPAWISGTATLATTVTQAPGGNMSQFLDSGLPSPSYTFVGGGLPTGMSLNFTTGAIGGAPALGTTRADPYSITLSASNGAGGAGSKTINVTVAKTTQAITFNPSDVQYSFSPVQLTATSPASSGTFTWSSLTPSVCTMDFAYVTSVAVGTCTVTVQHNGDTDYLASPVVQKSFAIQPASQTITFTAPAARRLGDGAFNFGNSGNTGSAFSTAGLTPIAVGTLTPLICTVSSPTVTPVAVGLCRLTLDQAGNAIYGAAPQQVAEFSVTANTVPGAPTVTIVNRGNASATVHFFGATDNGGSAILDYTATCGTQSSPAGTTSPLAVTGLANGTQVGCTVKARNAVGSGAASNSVNVTPALAPAITSANSAAFTRTQAGTFTVTATGDPAPTFPFNGTLPTGVSLNPTTGLLSGTPAMGSASSYLIEIVATNVGGTSSQFFTLSIARLPQSITFTQPANKALGSGNAQMTATVPATGPVTFGIVPASSSICASAGSNSIQLLAIGTCTVIANHNGDPDYLAAPQVSKSFQITATVPDPPTNVQATPGNGQATFAFGAPGFDGGAAITGYSVSCNPGGLAVSGPASPLTLMGLVNGTQYGCQVRATNSVGQGAPANTSVIPGKLAQTISFTQPANVVFGSVPSVTLTATATSGTPVTFTSNTTPVCTIQNPNTAVLVAVGTCTVTASHPGNADYEAAPSVSRSFSITSAAAPQFQASTSALSFGGQSMGTSSPAMPITVANTGNATLTVSLVSIDNAQFAQTNNCTSVAPSATCTINVTFSPTAGAGGLNATAPIAGTLSITSNANGSPHSVSLSGSAEKSLVTHYYRSILRRAPDAGGSAFWAAEATRVAALNVNVSEVWFAMAQQFYTSPEYLALNRDDTGFITDLYNTFFNRPPDSGGLAFWLANLGGGMPREVALAEFMFSAEFRSFARAIFGDTAARAEVDAVVDFYRGLLARLPDDGGFQFWVSKFRQAQCTQPPSAASAAIIQQVESISKAYTDSAEYAGRGRSNAQFVGDLYNAFLRRGGDLDGVKFWIAQVTSGAQTREQLRVLFKNSAEFQGRVNAMIAQGCN